MSAEPPETPIEARPGDIVDARLPGMSGKIRPGLVGYSFAHDGRAFHVVLPLTTQRTNQPGAWPIAHPSLRPSFALAPVAALIPARLLLGLRGRVTDAEAARAAAELDRWFGADWRETHPQIQAPRDAAKTLNGATLKR